MQSSFHASPTQVWQDAELTSQTASVPSISLPPLLMLCHSSYIPHFDSPLHSFTGEVGSSSNIPSFISSAGLGRCCSFCSRLSARMCFSNSFRWPSMAGAALESGRMFPKKSRRVSPFWGPFAIDRPTTGEGEKFFGIYLSYAQSAPPSPDASPTLSSSCRWLVGAPVPAAWIVSPCFPHPIS